MEKKPQHNPINVQTQGSLSRWIHLEWFETPTSAFTSHTLVAFFGQARTKSWISTAPLYSNWKIFISAHFFLTKKKKNLSWFCLKSLFIRLRVDQITNNGIRKVNHLSWDHSSQRKNESPLAHPQQEVESLIFFFSNCLIVLVLFSSELTAVGHL